MKDLGTMMEYPLTLDRLLGRAGGMFADVEVVSRLPDRSIHRTTYGAIHRRAMALGEALQSAGLGRGDRVATLMWNHAIHLEAYLAVPLAGGVVHTLNLRLSPDDLGFIVRHAEDRFLLVDEVLLPLFGAFRERVSFAQVWVVPPDGGGDYARLLESARGDWQPPSLRESDACGMCYTSGTTGKPKGVVYTHRSTVLHTLGACLADTLGVNHRDVVLPVVPMFHANAWGLPYAATTVGAKLVFPGPHLDAESILGLLEAEQVTLAGGVPTVWISVLEALDRDPGRWKLRHGLRMVVGGSAVPEALIRGLDRHGLTLVHSWGMTEMSPLGSVCLPGPEVARMTEDERYAQRARQGRPVPLVEFRARGDAGDVPWDGRSTGELEVRGAWVAARYHDASEADDRWTEDGWLRTGDVVALDARGSIQIKDRTKDLIKSGGEWISSLDLENALMGHPAVREAAVVAAPHPKWGERPIATVVLRGGAQVTAGELRDHLARRFARIWLPDAFVFAESIPRNAAGKFLKSALRDRYAGWTWEE